MHGRDCVCVGAMCACSDCAYVEVHMCAGMCVCRYSVGVQEPSEICARYVPFPSTPKGDIFEKDQEH